MTWKTNVTIKRGKNRIIKVIVGTCSAWHKQSHRLISLFFLSLLFPTFIQSASLNGLILSLSQKCWKPAWRPQQIHHFLHFSLDREEKFGCYWEADLAWQFNIKPPERCIIFLWLVWLRWLKLMKNARLLSSVTPEGIRTRWYSLKSLSDKLRIDWNMLEKVGGRESPEIWLVDAFMSWRHLPLCQKNN